MAILINPLKIMLEGVFSSVNATAVGGHNPGRDNEMVVLTGCSN